MSTACTGVLSPYVLERFALANSELHRAVGRIRGIRYLGKCFFWALVLASVIVAAGGLVGSELGRPWILVLVVSVAVIVLVADFVVVLPWERALYARMSNHLEIQVRSLGVYYHGLTTWMLPTPGVAAVSETDELFVASLSTAYRLEVIDMSSVFIRNPIGNNCASWVNDKGASFVEVSYLMGPLRKQRLRRISIPVSLRRECDCAFWKYVRPDREPVSIT